MYYSNQILIKLVDYNNCTGCAACASICPKGCIFMREDEEGFLQPYIETSLCITCHRCENACPIISPYKKEHYGTPFVYAAYSRNESIRMDSTSGGIFSELALRYFQNGDYVGGAVYKEDHTVSHILTNDINQLPQMRSSKYLQSNTEDVFQQVRRVLDDQKKVLFCGAPCQVAALYSYLGDNPRNLVSLDFICRGANSPKAFLSYMNMLERQHGAKAISIKFKNKKWGWHRFAMRVVFSNGKEYCQDRYHDLFFIGYLHAGNFCRRSCYQCKFKGFPQSSDITLADFWGIEKLDKSMDQDKGTSLVMVHTKKGMSLFESIKSHVVYKPFSFAVLNNNHAANRSLVSSVANREGFFSALGKLPFEEIANLFFPKLIEQ